MTNSGGVNNVIRKIFAPPAKSLPTKRAISTELPMIFSLLLRHSSPDNSGPQVVGGDGPAELSAYRSDCAYFAYNSR